MLDELLRYPGVTEQMSLAGSIGVMALHGGLEHGTAEAAHSVATHTGSSHYAVVQPDNLYWHIPSIHYNPVLSPQLRAFLEHISFGVSFHGYGRQNHRNTVLLGGRNRDMARKIGEAIRRRSALTVISDLDEIPAKLSGMHPKNPVNLPENGGVQVELSPGARTPDNLTAVVNAVANTIEAESASLCPRPQ